MYSTIREYQTDPTSIDEIERQAETNFVPLVSNAPGFRDYYFIDGGNGTFATVSLFANRSDGENFNQVGMDWVQKNLGSLLPSKPKVTSGEVRIHATAAALVP